MTMSEYERCDRKVTFECQRCGRCCTDFFVNLGYNDLLLLKDKASLQGKVVNATAMNKITGKEETRLSLPYPCPFFDAGNKKCAIYEFRPKTCRIFPFFARNEKAGVVYFYESGCPGVGKGGRLDLFETYRLVKDLNKDIRLLENRGMAGRIFR